MKKSTKILVLLLSLTLILAGLVIAASAEESVSGATYVDANGETQTASDLATAIANAKEGTTVTLTGDTTVSASITVTKTITIDLNGYTLDSTTTEAAFIVNNNTASTKFNFVGNGTVNVAGAFVTDSAKSDNFEANIVGGTSGIVVNHTSTSVTMVEMKKGTWTISGLNVSSAIATSSRYIFSANGAVNVNIAGLNVTASAAKDGISGGNNAALLYLKSTAHVKVNYTKFTSKGIAAFWVENHQTKNDDLLKVDNCYISVEYANGQSSLVTTNWGYLGSDIIISNSYCSVNQRTIINNSANGAAIILRNSVLNHNGSSSAFFRSTNVKLEAGSVLTGSHPSFEKDVQILSNAAGAGSLTVGSQSNVNLILYKGSRFCESMYNKLMSRTGTKADGKTAITYYNDGQIVYEDGSKPIGSTTYKIVYDPQGNTEYPYVVVDYDYVEIDKPTYEYVTINNFVNNLTVWNSAGTRGNETTVTQNQYYYLISDGSKNSSGKNPELLVKKATITENAYDVVVIDTDFASDVFGGLTAFKFGIQTNDGNTIMFRVANDGTVTYSDLTAAADAPKKLSDGEWHRATVVIDIKNGNIAYCYIDGVYVGSRTMSKVVTGETGPRFSIDGMNDKHTSIFVDNTYVRGYGDNTGSALTDNGAKFLSANGGKAVNKGIVESRAVRTALGYPVATLNDLPGATLNLKRDIKLEQTITENGVNIATNGYALKYTKESLPAYITLGSDGVPANYDFNSSYGTLDFKFFFGNYTDEAELADPAYWNAVAVKLGHAPANFYTGPEMADLVNFERDNHWYNEEFLGWALENRAYEVNAALTTPVYPEFAAANKDKAVEVYPAYKATLVYSTAVILNADGSFNRGLSKGTSLYGSGWDLVLLAYGETLVLQQDINSQTSLNRIFTAASKASGTDEKVISLDLNGHVLKVDTNWTQTNETYNSPVNSILSTGVGETVNVYSSYPGGKIANYGVKNGAATGGILFQVNGGATADDTAATIEANANGETTQFNATLNIGTVTVNGKTIPGSNLTLEGSNIINAETGDSTCKINVDGVTAVRNSSDFTGMFVNRNYFGEMNITNCVIVNPVNSAIIDGHENSIVDSDEDGKLELTDKRALGKVLFDNCTIITKSDGGNIVGNNYSLESLTFTNCTTNGRIGGSKLAKVVVIGEGNTVFQLAANNFTNGTVKANWNNAMTLDGENTITVTYITLNPDVAATSRDWDYIENSYVIAIGGYEGEADQLLPVLASKTVKAEEALEVTFKGVGNHDDVTALYANGAQIVNVPTPETYVGAIVTLTPDGTYDKEIATVVTESVVYTPNAEAKANITGLKANLSLYANFNVNLYIPATYKDVVTVEGYTFKEVNVSGVDYMQVTADQLCSNAADNIVFTLNISELGFTAQSTVTVSIVSYANSILSNEKHTDADKVLMCYMLNYANEAEKFFDGAANESIANLLDTYKDYTAKYNYVKDYENKKVENTNLSDAFVSATLSLESAPAFVLTLKDGFEGTVTVKYGENNVRTYTVTKDNARAITIEGMKVYNFGTYLEITAVGTIGETEINVTNGKYTLDTFAAYHETNAADENSETKDQSLAALDLIAALSAYAEVAEQYKLGTLEAAINPPVAE
ncbi:MAG: LamG domain-containing protein [Ruminococcaceae bacterium]|nr:LamG domain-containing protein [Oscillospiraceae bacterium]